MPKPLPRSFSDDFLRGNGILALDRDTLLQPAEAAVLLGTTTMSLERARKAGDPPPFRQAKPRAAVRYALGDVLAARQLHRHQSIAAVATAHEERLVSHLTFHRFLSAGKSNDEWPFVVVCVRHVDRPVDFFQSMTLPIETRKGVRWLTLMEYLSDLQNALEIEPRAKLSEQRQNEAIAHKPGVSSKSKVRSRT